MGGATFRFVTLISSPSPLLHHCRPSFLLLRRFSSSSSSLFLSPLLPLPLHLSPLLYTLKCSQQLHSQARPLCGEIPSVNSNRGLSSSAAETHHPWSEFSDFVSWVSRSGYCNAPLDVRHLVGTQQLSQQFLKDANACLTFARDHPSLLWSLPMEDIEVVVENGSPFLFQDASAAAARMKSFLRDGSNDVLESDKPSTVDLMEFLLSYAHLAFCVQESMQRCSRVESSVRKLFSELAKSKGVYIESVATVQKQSSEAYVQAPTSFVKGVEMKKGDWICPRCSFMNFAKNSHCFQCEEHRPKKFLIGGEWECPQCDFFNFSRNVACLRCDCKKPEIHPHMNPSSVSGLSDHTSSVKGNTVKKIAETEVEQQWFTKIRQMEESSDMSSALADEDVPETLKARDSRFAASARNSGVIDNIEQSIGTAGNENNFKFEISQCLDELIGNRLTNNKVSDSRKNSRASSLSAMPSSAPLQYGQRIEQNSGLETYSAVPQPVCTEKPLSQMENTDYEREQAEKSETPSKKVAQLHDVKDLPSAMSDDNFPETMPMRKGENRFVVSRKKDRSLTSPTYKRQAAMEQASNNNYVPFVPFPPGYFAKDKSQEGSDSIHSAEQSKAISSNPREAGERMEDRTSNRVLKSSNNMDQNSNSFDFESTSRVEHSKAQSIGSWRGKSLEASAVKEPDPLDMSEEAKAERWFRRVAQIKDISELSQIPDEDFPSIMPMRKGVNRFVVSKRKTPLERRLTSSQYRKNPPAVNADPTRKETDSN